LKSAASRLRVKVFAVPDELADRIAKETLVNTRTLVARIVSLLPITLLTACGGGGGSSGVTHWLGDTPHLAVSGSFQGQKFDVDLEGADAAGVYCHRFYAPLPGTAPDSAGNYDTGQMYFVMKELGGVIDLDGTPTEFTISYWRHDMPAGSTLQVIPREFGTSIAAGKTWSDINLFTPGGDVLSGIESAAASGTVAMKLNSGDPDQNGVVIPSGGRTGEFVSVSWGPQDSLNVSATADCSPAFTAVWAQSRILP
jgi:hypothetical protein